MTTRAAPRAHTARALRCALTLAAALTGACQRPATQLLARVETDFVEPDPLTAVALVVETPEGARVSEQTLVLARAGERPSPGRYALPLSAGIVPLGGDASRRVRVIAQGLGADGRPRVQRSALTGFVRGASLLLPLFLPRACADVMCPRGTTCVPSTPPRCVSDTVPPDALPVVPPGARDGGEFGIDAALPLDGAPVPPVLPDGGVAPDDAPRDDATRADAGGDAPTDARADAVSEDDAPVVASDAMIVPNRTGRLGLGADFSTFVRADSTARAWGGNGSGQLGDGSTVPRPSPVAVSSLSGATQITAGNAHTCARTVMDTVVCWGSNGNGQLGNGTVTPTTRPGAPIRLTPSGAEVRAGWYHTCARTPGGAVYCWGSNASGQVGAGALGSDAMLPMAVGGVANVGALALGARHSCALQLDGVVRCWGLNESGQLGDGTLMNRAAPVTVLGLAGVRVVAIAAGSDHTCALAEDGTVRCWGSNTAGQLGDGTMTHRMSAGAPVVGLAPATEVVAGAMHTCARDLLDAVFCWGSNALGQIGDGTATSPRTSPTRVSGLTDAIELGASTNHTCAVRSDETVRCWGSNVAGQLGDGTTNPRAVPVTVAF